MTMNKYEKDNIERLRPYLAECTVLLKKNGAFPLDAPCRIAAFGSGVRDTVKGGTGSGEVNSRYFVNIEEGLKGAGFNLVNPYWSDMYEIFRHKAKEEFKKLYIAHKLKTNFVDVVPQKAGLRISVNLDFDEVYDPEGICRDVTDLGRWGNGDVEIRFESLDKLDAVMEIIKQAIEKQK